MTTLRYLMLLAIFYLTKGGGVGFPLMTICFHYVVTNTFARLL